MKLTTETGGTVTVMSFDQVRTALSCLHENGNSFAVLERDDGRYIQTAVYDSGMVVEKQEDGLDHHFRAQRNGSTAFTNAEVQQIFETYYTGSMMPIEVVWEPMALKPTPEIVVTLLKALPWAAAVALVFFFARDVGRFWGSL